MPFVEAGGRRGAGLIAAALIALVCALALPAAASASVEFEVNSTANEADLPVPGCLTAGGKCTLQAAIEAANSSANTLEELDRISFDPAVFDGGATSTIAPAASLPAIVEPVQVNGGECLHGVEEIHGPCVGINGPGASEPALTVEKADGVEILGLAITGASTAINIFESEEVRVNSSWLGVKLDGGSGANTTGIFVDPKSNRDRIGGEGEGAGNVFANNVAVGLDIIGADETLVLGNYFGVKPDGATVAANGKDIEANSQGPAGFEASGTVIGVRVESAAATTSVCDLGCNVISGSLSHGIDLQGNGGEEEPAVATRIAGNFIGLSADGSTAVPNAEAGIKVGSATETSIGGLEEGDPNHINGGQFGVFAGNAGVAAEDLDVLNNIFGRNAAGATLSPSGAPISIDSAGLASEVDAAEVTGNLISMAGGGIAIEQHGPGALISDNKISGAGFGVRAYGDTELIGNLIADNVIEGSEADGVLVENDFNEVLGNEVFDSGGSGIHIQSFASVLPATENLIGGDVDFDENVVSGSGARAIEISDIEGTINEVARNRGSANSGPFIDLIAANPGTEPVGPNGGIKPPAFSTSTQSAASGSGAKEGAVIRVFRKASAEAGELESFLAETQADVSGNWKVSYPGQIPTATIVAATQTSKGATSELATATSTADPQPPACSTAGAAMCVLPPAPTPPVLPVGPGSTVPETKIDKGRQGKSDSTTATFKFSSTVKGSTFQCKLDKKPFKSCKSPKKYKQLKPGKHVFRVRAVDSSGVADPTPAKRKFTVLG